MYKRESICFTLLELLVVIAVIMMLTSILLPSLGKAKSSAYHVKCKSNLKQLSQFGFLYADSYDAWLLPASDERFTHGQRWQYHLNDTGILKIPVSNQALSAQGVSICPSNKYRSMYDAVNGLHSNYALNCYSGFYLTASGYSSIYPRLKISGIKGSPAQKIMFGDARKNDTYIPNNVDYYSMDAWGLGVWHGKYTDISFYDGHASGVFRDKDYLAINKMLLLQQQ